MKKQLRFENYKNYLEATQLAKKINYLEKNKIDIDSLKKIINNSVFKKQQINIKTQQTFKSERHNVFTEGIDKIVLSSNDDKRMQ